MIGPTQRRFARRQERSVPQRANCAVVQLAEAYDYAQKDREGEPWQFAVEMESLLAVGVTIDDLAWLVQGRYIEHAREVTRPEDAWRDVFAGPRVEICAANVLRLDRGRASALRASHLLLHGCPSDGRLNRTKQVDFLARQITETLHESPARANYDCTGSAGGWQPRRTPGRPGGIGTCRRLCG